MIMSINISQHQNLKRLLSFSEKDFINRLLYHIIMDL